MNDPTPGGFLIGDVCLIALLSVPFLMFLLGKCFRSRSEAEEASNSSPSSSSGSQYGSSSSVNKMHFRPSSPPPKSKHRRPDSFLLAKNPMSIYVLDVGRVLTERVVTWQILEGINEGPEDTVLFNAVIAVITFAALVIYRIMVGIYL